MRKIKRENWIKLILFITGLLLFFFTVNKFPIENIFTNLKRLSLKSIIFLLAVNIIIEFTLAGRWWIFLKRLERPISYIRLSFYKLAAIAISYATPGPQFGGEPYQVYILNKNHKISKSRAISSIILERLFELSFNFSFLLVGLSIILWDHNFISHSNFILIAFSGIVFILPVSVLLLMATRHYPLFKTILFLNKIAAIFVKNGVIKLRWLDRINETEELVADTLSQSPRSTVDAILFSFLNWLGLVGEFWLLYFLLGLNLSPVELITLLASARLAFLLPIPAGLGTLEASQMFALASLGLDPGIGISACLVIRARDLFFVISGLVTMQITLMENA